MKQMQNVIAPAFLVLALITATVYAQSDTPPATQPNQQDRMMNGGMMMGKMDKMKGMSPEQRKQWCQDMGMTEQEMARCRIMVDTSIRATDPQALLANQADLDLSQEQAQQVERIAEQARQDALAVLTDAQRKQLEAIGDEPTGMMQMHQQMMKRMKARMKQTGGQDKQMMMGCPMNMMMHGMSQNASAATQPDGTMPCCLVKQQ
jgi:hypothetical protein